MLQKVYQPTFNDNDNGPIPVIFGAVITDQMAPKDCIIYHLSCLVYVSYPGKLYDPENYDFPSNSRYIRCMKLNVKL